ATIGTSSATLTITEDDAAPSQGGLALASTVYSVSEDGSSVTITVNRSGGSSGAVSVDYATTDDTATAGNDYVAASGTLNWSDGDAASKSFTITISDDSVYEGDEGFNVSLSNVTGGASLGASSATVTITEDDVANQAPAAPTLISVADGSIDVDGSSVTLEWNAVNDPDGDVVTYTLYHCEDASFTGCSGMQVASVMNSPVMLAGLGGGMGLAMLGMIGTGTRRQRLFSLIAVVMMTVVLSGCEGNIEITVEPVSGDDRSNAMSNTLTGLQSGTTYYWKVVASDGMGGEASSETWSFTTL
ncbi:MAG: hypothetical protein HUJ29_04715, partial [Gammaproteobacteria bacterium]|nr:hypothetical protein [Gammaproteobacteria bacterium]